MRNLKRNLKKGLSALLMVAMLFTSVSIPEMSVNAAPTEDEIIDISVSDDEVIVEESTVEESTTEVATTEEVVVDEVKEEVGAEDVNAEATTYTFYYYCESENAPGALISGVFAVDEAYSADTWYYTDWDKTYYKMQKAETDNWWKIEFTYDASADEWYVFEVYEMSGVTEDSNTVTSQPTWKVGINSNKEADTTDFMENATDNNFYYKSSAYYESIEAAGSSATFTDNVKLYFYVTDEAHTAPAIAVPTELEGLTPIRTESTWTPPVWVYSLTNEGDGWWSFEGKLPYDTISIYGAVTSEATGEWVVNIDVTEKSEFLATEGTKVYYNIEDSTWYATADEATGNIEVTFEVLTALITEADKLVKSDYKEEGWTNFETALTAAKELTNSSETAAIETAYNNLKTAMEALVVVDVEFTLYYYAGLTDKTVGLYHWGSDLTSTAATADWGTWGSGDTWVMTAVDGYAGWYSIPLTVSNGADAEASFGIATGPENVVYKCEASNENKDVFAQLISKETDSYAIWNGILLSGDEIATAQKNITLYVRDAEAVPYIKVENSELTYLNASGVVTKLTADEYTDKETDNYYAMEAVDGEENWYSLTFIVPEGEEGAKVACIYSGTASWKKDLLLGTSSLYGVDITTVFAGKPYYKDGVFYTSIENAEGYMLGQLKELVNSDEVAAIVANGESKYTSGWTDFNTALTAAQELIASDTYKDVADTVIDETISAAYSALADAIDKLVEKPTKVNIYYYNEKATVSGNSLYLLTYSDSIIRIDSEDSEKIYNPWETIAYKPEIVADSMYSGWTSIPVSLFSLTQNGVNDDDEGIVYHVLDSNGLSIDSLEISGWNTPSLFNALVSTQDGGYVYIKGTEVFDSIYDAEVSPLQDLVKEAETVRKNKDSYKEIGWTEFIAALTAATDLLAADVSTHTREALADAYTKLEAAMALLQFNMESEINVQKVNLAENFITGADLSSYISLKDSGVVFKDKKGNALSDQEFFDMLYEGGTNWVRIRVWNDPYNGNGNGYGGGNNDLDKAVKLGKLATNAGMRVLIDFHYSDFWADPAKQDVPKAWVGYTLEQKKEAVYDFTLSSLNTLKAAGVDVGMVQVGNETNNAICGESSWEGMAEIFNAGSSAVRAFDENCLVAVHFTDPQDGFSTIAGELDSNNVDYDVFASSYYPFWHGTTADLTSALSDVASTYGKKVMVAETSWTTTWEDGDGHGNSAPKTSGQDLNYAISVQGQADEMRDVVNAVNKVNEVAADSAVGVFYWEPAWLSKYYAYNADGSLNEAEYKKNQALWEEFGSGWASSYSSEYDPSDAGLWYGGSAIDNQAWFDFDGTALATVEAYALMRTGATAPLKISQVERQLTADVALGETIPWDELSTVTATFNNGTTKEYKVVWNEDEKVLVNSDKLGTFVVTGVATCSYESTSADVTTTVTEKYDVTLTLKVLASGNVLENPGFELFNADKSMKGWVLTYDESCPDTEADPYVVLPKTVNEDGNPRTGAYGLNFFRKNSDMKFTVTQTLTDLAPGSYTYGGYIQGGSADSEDVQYAYVDVYKNTVSGNVLSASYKAEAGLSGWLNWANPEIKGIKVEAGDTVVVGMEVNTTKAGAWGSIDDMYLYGSYDVEVKDVENGNVTVSNLEAVSGEVIRIAASPNKGYTLTSISVSGNAIDNEFIVKSDKAAACVYDEATKTVTLSYENNAEAVTYATFTMPDDKVCISATFESIFEEGTKIYVSDNLISVSEIDTQWYTGRPIKPAFTVSYLGYVLKAGKDYTAAYADNTKVGEATITLTGKGDFTGTREVKFTIAEDKREKLTNYKVVFNDYDDEKAKAYYYAGDYIEPSITLVKETVSGNDIVDVPLDSEEYNVYYQNNRKVGGSANVIVIAKYDAKTVKGSLTQKFKIAKCPVSELTISKPSGSTYTGKAITPNVTVKQGNVVLQKGKDYTVTYKNNKFVSKIDDNGDSTTYMIVKGKGNYTGSSENLFFKITAKSLKDGNVTATVADLAYTGRTLNPKVVVKDAGKVVAAKQYTYTVTRVKDVSGNVIPEEPSANGKVTESGTYKVVITGKDNYKDSIETEFTVKDKKFLLSRARVSTVKQTYTGNKITLEKSGVKGGEVVVTIDGKILDPSVYEVQYLDNTNIKVGTAKIRIVPSKGSEYFGRKDATFKIEKRKMAAMPESVSGNTVTLDAKKGYLSYTIVKDDIYGTTQYYTGHKLTPDVIVKSVNDGVTKTLTEGIDYKITYSKNVKSGDSAQIKIAGKGNYSGSVTFKDVFTVEDRTLDDFIITVDPVSYTGKALKPVVKFVDKETGVQVNLKAGTAYSITYKNNKEVAGKAANKAPYVIIKEKGLNKAATSKQKASETIKFTITTAKITAADVKDIAVQTFRNKPIEPKLTIKVSGKALRLNKDYVVSFENNTRLGKATVKITGIGNYAGTVEKTFIIK